MVMLSLTLGERRINIAIKLGIVFSKQDMELFVIFPDLQSKHLFHKIVIIDSHESKPSFGNRNCIIETGN